MEGLVTHARRLTRSHTAVVVLINETHAETWLGHCGKSICSEDSGASNPAPLRETGNQILGLMWILTALGRCKPLLERRVTSQCWRYFCWTRIDSYDLRLMVVFLNCPNSFFFSLPVVPCRLRVKWWKTFTPQGKSSTRPWCTTSQHLIHYSTRKGLPCWSRCWGTCRHRCRQHTLFTAFILLYEKKRYIIYHYHGQPSFVPKSC